MVDPMSLRETMLTSTDRRKIREVLIEGGGEEGVALLGTQLGEGVGGNVLTSSWLLWLSLLWDPGCLSPLFWGRCTHLASSSEQSG